MQKGQSTISGLHRTEYPIGHYLSSYKKLTANVVRLNKIPDTKLLLEEKYVNPKLLML